MMKAVDHNSAIDEPVEHAAENWMHTASEAEAAENWEEAAKAYEKVIVKDKLNEYAYNRLMMIYRKFKEYKKELKLIDTAIAVYQKFYASKLKKKSKSVTDISMKLNKAFGLSDKKGNAVYEPEPIARWKKRRAVVEKRLK